MRKTVATIAQAALASIAFATAVSGFASELSADQIVDKYSAATGGLEAWRKIQSMVWMGHIQSPNAPMPSMPFVLEFKRPNKMRFEVGVQSQSALHVFDGTHGWKVRSTAGGQPAVHPYSQEELDFARDADGMDGPLMDYKAKGVTVALEGVEEVAGHKAYRLAVTLPSGTVRHVWIDAQSFLETRADRAPAHSAPKSAPVPVFYRDYRQVEGLQIPFMVETGVASSGVQDKMMIDRVVLNPPLEDRIFTLPSPPPTSRRPHARDLDAMRSRFRPGNQAVPMFPAPGRPTAAGPSSSGSAQ